MFTLQSPQLQSAIRGQFGSTPTAQDMVQALCNCAQVVEHRGPMQFTFTDPAYSAFPGVRPPAGLQPPPQPGNVGGEPAPPGNTYINFPPWQPIPYEALPFLDWPEPEGWLPSDLTLLFSRPEPNVWVTGRTEMGDVDAGAVTTTTFTTEQITNQGDTYTFGDAYTSGDTYIDGTTNHGGNVTNESDVTTRGDTTNQGDSTTEGNAYFLGDAYFNAGATFFAPITVVVNNRPLTLRRAKVLSAVRLVANGCSLRVEADTIDAAVFGRPNLLPERGVGVAANNNLDVVTEVTWDEVTRTFISTTQNIDFFGCPVGAAVDADVFVSKAAKFDPDDCKIVEDEADPPEYDPIQPPAP